VKNFLHTPPHLLSLPAGLTQNKYTKFKTAPENKKRTVFDRATERVNKARVNWKLNHFWKGELSD
jgi:hypothetical protein